MRLEFWVLPGNWAVPNSPWGWGWTIVGFLAVLGLWVRRRRDLRSFGGLPAAAVGGFLLLALATALTPVLAWDGFPGLPFRVGFPVLLWLPYLIWGGRLGPGTLGLVGLIAGAAAGFTIDGRLLHLPWIVALDAAGIGMALSQNYVGRPFRLLRHPLAAALLGWALWLSMQVISWGSFYPTWPEALDGIWTLFTALAIPSGVSALLSGGIAWGLHRRWPHALHTRQPPRWPRYGLQIQARFLAFFSLWIGLVILALLASLAVLAIQQARAEQLQAMGRGVARAGEQIAYFMHTGDTLLADMAALGVSPDEAPPVVAAILRRFVQTGPIYHAVLLVEADGEIRAAYPVEEQTGGLSMPERSALAQAQTAQSVIHTEVHRLPDGTVGLSFVAPLEKGPPFTFLIGRVHVAEHPALQEALAALRGLPASEGFVIDPQGRILLHPDPQRLLDVFPLPTPVLSGPLDVAERSSTGTVNEIHLRRLPGTDWWAVIRYPRSLLIQRALELVIPPGGILLAFAGIGAATLNVMSRLLTRRLRRLVDAAGRMAGGELELPIRSDAPDEVGQLAEAMEHMRQGLRARIQDLSLLLELNQRLVETVDLAHGLPEVAGALERATQAARARILIPGPEGALRAFTAAGESEPDPPDQACWALGRERAEPLWVERVSRQADLPPILRQESPGRALGILPIRLGEETVGIAWLAFAQPRRVSASGQQLARLILSQAAVFIARARLYEAAMAERERLRAVLESSPDVLLVIDARGDLLYLNPAAEHFLGLAAPQALGQPVVALLRDAELLELLNEPLSPAQIQSREFSRPDGRTFWAGRYDLRLGDGREIGRLLFVRDITPFKALDRLKSDFIAAISHDLRSPLTYVRGFVTMLGMAGPLTSRQREYVEKIMGGIDQITRLIEDLMDLKRIEEGIGQRGICRMSDLLRDVFHEMRPHAMARGLRMAMEVQGQGIVHGDSTWLRRAIVNLVDNAIKYTPEGGTITLGLLEQGEEVVVWVRDTGVGIPPADQARIFEKFYRVRRKETAHIKGSGLGLALVKSIVEWHGGRIWVESQLGQGSTFYLAIPVASVPFSTPPAQGTRNR